MNSRESLLKNNIQCWMVLCFEKWVYPSNEIVMFIIVEVLLKELDFKKLLHKHLMSQLNPCTVRYLNHYITIILAVLLIVELKVILQLFVQFLIYTILLFHLLEQ